MGVDNVYYKTFISQPNDNTNLKKVIARFKLAHW